MNESQSIAIITEKCNQNCIFCSGFNRGLESEEKILELIKKEKNSICFEGGEPTLSENLIKFIELSKENKTKDIILVTNGVMLSYKLYCEKLLKAGVTLFSISFHNYNEKKDNALTRTVGNFRKRIEGIKNLVALGAGKKVRLTFVVYSGNYKDIKKFLMLVKREFPSIFYVEINLIKKLGYVEKYPKLINLIPRLSDIKPFLLEALDYAKNNNISVILDGFPLCLVPGYEKLNIDTDFFISNKDNAFIQEKYKPFLCKECSLTEICSGIRKDYFEIYGDKDLVKQTKNVAEVYKTLD